LVIKVDLPNHPTVVGTVYRVDHKPDTNTYEIVFMEEGEVVTLPHDHPVINLTPALCNLGNNPFRNGFTPANVDHLDFREVSRSTVRELLQQAYALGARDAGQALVEL
jgi:hypothetical protein